MDDNTFSGGTLTVPTPDNPAAALALAEHAKVMSDTTHPMYAGYHRHPQDPEAEAYVSGLYRKAYPQTTAPPPDHGVSVTTGSPEDPPALSAEDLRAMQAERDAWGEDYSSHMADMQFGLNRIASVLGGERADPGRERDALGAAVLAAIEDLPPETRSGVNGLTFLRNILRHFGIQARTYAN